MIENDYVLELEQKLNNLLILGSGDGISYNDFNDVEHTYENAKAQQPKHTTIETFRLIAVEYYTQKIKDAKEKGEDPFAYERALARYTIK